MPDVVTFRGSASLEPSTGSALSTACALTLNFDRTYQRSVSMNLAASGTDLSPVALEFGSIVSGRFFVCRVTGGEVRLHITTPDGTAQVIPVTDSFMLHNPNVGSQMTAIAMSVDAAGPSIEYILAGDES